LKDWNCWSLKAKNFAVNTPQLAAEIAKF